MKGDASLACLYARGEEELFSRARLRQFFCHIFISRSAEREEASRPIEWGPGAFLKCVGTLGFQECRDEAESNDWDFDRNEK